jgi:HK97 family phage major capsid protein
VPVSRIRDPGESKGDMMNSLKLKEQLGGLLDEATAISNLAAKDDRELHAEEQARIEAIVGTDGNGGEVARIKARIAQAEAIEAEIRNVAASRVQPVRVEQSASPVASSGIIIPARAARYRASNLAKHMPQAEADRTAYGLGRWYAAVLGHESSRQWCADNGIAIQNAMTEGFDSKGSYLVPEQFEAAVVALLNEYGVARRSLNVVAMTSDTKVQPRRTGGLTVYGLGEASSITPSDITYDQVRLIAKKFGILSRHSSELAEDAAVSMGDEFAREIAYAFAEKEDQCSFNGDGTSTYNGIVGIKNALAAGAKYTALTGNTAFSTLDIEDFEGMTAKLASYAYMNGGPSWYISRAGWSQSIQRLQVAYSGSVADSANGAPPRFLGYPVVFVEVMNNTLTAQTSTDGLCYFGNLRMGGLFGDRRGIAVAQSADVYFASDEIAIRATERFDINIHDKGDANNAGSIVMLSTPGS